MSNGLATASCDCLGHVSADCRLTVLRCHCCLHFTSAVQIQIPGKSFPTRLLLQHANTYRSATNFPRCVTNYCKPTPAGTPRASAQHLAAMHSSPRKLMPTRNQPTPLSSAQTQSSPLPFQALARHQGTSHALIRATTRLSASPTSPPLHNRPPTSQHSASSRPPHHLPHLPCRQCRRPSPAQRRRAASLHLVPSPCPSTETVDVKPEPSFCSYYIPRYLVTSKYPCIECYGKEEWEELRARWMENYRLGHPLDKAEDVEDLSGVAGVLGKID